MTDVEQVQSDLRYVRNAVSRRTPGMQGSAFFYYMWAVYVLIGYALIDFNPTYANWFLLIGGVTGGVVGAIFHSRRARLEGEIDRIRDRQSAMHWGFGILGSVAATIALCSVIPSLRNVASGQICVVLIGMVYWMWGVYRDRSFLVLGPLLMIGGVVVGLIPHYAWTSLGLVIAGGLVASGILWQRRAARQAIAE